MAFKVAIWNLPKHLCQCIPLCTTQEKWPWENAGGTRQISSSNVRRRYNEWRRVALGGIDNLSPNLFQVFYDVTKVIITGSISEFVVQRNGTRRRSRVYNCFLQRGRFYVCICFFFYKPLLSKGLKKEHCSFWGHRRCVCWLADGRNQYLLYLCASITTP